MEKLICVDGDLSYNSLTSPKSDILFNGIVLYFSNNILKPKKLKVWRNHYFTNDHKIIFKYLES